jgi:Mlc titration factor MtfA (ptsG expression regulator)
MSEYLDIILISLFGTAVVGGVIASFFMKMAHRKELMEQPFPVEWQNILNKKVAIYKLLPHDLRHELHGWINIFLDEKEFEGCGGLEITDEVRLTVAALASVLLLNKKLDCYPNLNSILVYPSAYVAPGGPARMGNQIVYQEESARLGESWMHGNLVLAWDSVRYDARTFGTGHNVVIHEFAHQLDQADGVADGIPYLSDRGEYEKWEQVIKLAYSELVEEANAGIPDVIDEYGATNPAEFFAVASETFFCCPEMMREFHPELYQELIVFYKLDPCDWIQKKSR